MNKENKNGIMLIVIVAVIFGLGAGIVGNLIMGNFIPGSFVGSPFSGEINFGSGQGQNIVIRDAKKIVIEQDDKAVEAINSAKGSLVGIFKKISLPETSSASAETNLANYYKLGQEAAEGMIITSDGWIASAFTPENLNYVIITQDKKVYLIDKIIKDSLTGFSFIHAAAKDLPVLKFAERSGIKSGQLALAADWKGSSLLTAVSDEKNTNDNFLFFSDFFPDEIILTNEFSKDFSGQFIFNLSGEVIGALDGAGKIRPISHLEGGLNSLLKNQDVSRPSLGVNYVDLSRLVSAQAENNSGQNKNGALISKNLAGVSVVKGSAAGKAGLKEGDIIISVEGAVLDYNNNLTDAIQRLAAGETVSIIYLRDNREMEVKIVLGEM
jgi:hypothetical protein